MTAYSQISQIPLFRYGLIKADFPWKFVNWSPKGEDRNPSKHYKVMTIQDLYDIPMGQLMAPNSILWFWTTGPFEHEAHKMFDHWGIKYVTSGYWGKVQKHDLTEPKMGNGCALRECGEPFMIGKVGDPEFHDNGIRGLILAPRRESGRKPEQSYEFAGRMAPRRLPKLDMFSRQERDGWDCFGDETGKFGSAA